MSKDPAVLWYWNDFLTGTMTFSKHQIGCYVVLLGAQFNEGHLSLDQIKTVLGSDFGSTWPALQKKFKQDANGLFFNEKAEDTKNKRKAFTKSRRENLGLKDKHMVDHMENGNENDISIRKENFIEQVSKIENFPPEMLTEFCNYWTEHNPNGRKMRYEMEKTFDIGMRLSKWATNSKKFEKNNTQTVTNDRQQNRSEIERLRDASLASIKQFGTNEDN